MGTSAALATVLDQELIEVKGARIIAARAIDAVNLLPRTGSDVARELGGRYLLRYVLPEQVGLFVDGSHGVHHVTPTPYAPDDTVSYLYLPSPANDRLLVMLLEPARIPEIRGPRWIRLGRGIEYILPQGFPKDALVSPWEVWVT